MTTPDHSTIRITTADERGVPTHAECPCGWSWDRPDGDEWADTLPTAARTHQRAADPLG
jgi:hypothetical protein